MEEGPIWPADSRDAGNLPETYTIPGNTYETKLQRIILTMD
jgi:hypothetical protein